MEHNDIDQKTVHALVYKFANDLNALFGCETTFKISKMPHAKYGMAMEIKVHPHYPVNEINIDLTIN